MIYLFWLGMVLTIWRVTRLLVKDEFPPTAALRAWHIDTFGQRHSQTGELIGGKRWGALGFSIAYVWSCMWCMSFWVGLVLVVIADQVVNLSVPYPALLVAVASGVSGLIGSIEARIDQRYELAELELTRRREERP